MIKSNMPKFECKTCGFHTDGRQIFEDHMDSSLHIDAALKKICGEAPEMSEVVKSEYQIMDAADSKQIEQADTAVQQALVYIANGKKQLTYIGIKSIVLEMSQNEQPLEIPDLPSVELIKHDENNQKTWIWYATIKVKNAKTGLESIGASEQPFLDEYRQYQMDSFGRTKAISKAERNAFRKQIPEAEINRRINDVKPEDIHTLYNKHGYSADNSTNNEASQKQLDYMKNLGYNGPKPKSKQEASDIIESIKNGAKVAKPATTATDNDDPKVDPDRYCACDKFIRNAITKGKTCQTCLKLAPLEVA